MHPSLKDLLAYRDGEASPEVESHLAACPGCSEELAFLERVPSLLDQLPTGVPQGDPWPALAAAAKKRRRTRLAKLAWLTAASAAGIFLVLFTVTGLRVGTEGGSESLPRKALPVTRSSTKPDLKPLMSRSRELETKLENLKGGTPVLSGRTASTIARLQEEVAIVDLQISLLQGGEGKQDLLLNLWRERVRLLSNLVRIKTGEGGLTAV